MVPGVYNKNLVGEAAAPSFFTSIDLGSYSELGAESAWGHMAPFVRGSDLR